jgi:hypothetical protein
MAKNGHALIFVALKGANFTEVETIFDGTCLRFFTPIDL